MQSLHQYSPVILTQPSSSLRFTQAVIQGSIAGINITMLPFASTDKQEPRCLIHEASKSLLSCQMPFIGMNYSALH